MTYFRKHVGIIFLIAFITPSSCLSTRMIDEAIKKQESAKYYFRQKDYAKAKEFGEEALDLWRKLKEMDIKEQSDWSIDNNIEHCEHLIVSCAEKQWVSTPEVLKEPTTVPIQIDNDAIFVNATINSEESATLLLDTGASSTILTPSVAKLLGINPRKEAPKRTLSLIGGKTIRVPFVHVSEIRVGDAIVNNLLVGVSTTGFNVSSIDGILGLDFLKHFTVTVDREASQLKLESPTEWQGDSGQTD